MRARSINYLSHPRALFAPLVFGIIVNGSEQLEQRAHGKKSKQILLHSPRKYSTYSFLSRGQKQFLGIFLRHNSTTKISASTRLQVVPGPGVWSTISKIVEHTPHAWNLPERTPNLELMSKTGEIVLLLY